MGEVAVVTGASGYIASEVVKQLLEKGYNVRGTVRSTSSKEKTAHLTALGEALPGQLTLHEADLLKPGSFDEVVRGASYVIHTASPFLASAPKDPQKELVDPALLGTKNVLGSAVLHKATVKRVVVTSSFAAVVNDKKGPPSPPRYDEKSWNTDSTLETGAYRLSKTLAEKEAWQIAKENGLDLSVINPTFVMGPVLSNRTDATSVLKTINLLNGQKEGFLPWLCDVRDVARGHVLAIENEAAKGKRFIISQADTYNMRVVSDAIKKAFPAYQIMDLDENESEPLLDNTQALTVLGLGQLHDPRETVVDMARSILAKGIAKPVSK